MLQKKRRRMFSALFAIAVLLLPIALYLYSLQDKTLTSQIISHSRLAGNDVPAEELVILHNQVPVRELSLHSLKIENSGYTPILPDDFERPLSISVNDTSTLYSGRVKSTRPADLSIVSKITGNTLVIEPLKLDPGDYFEVDLYSSSDVAPTTNTGIAGSYQMVQAVSESNTRTKYFSRSSLLFAFAALYGVFGRFSVSRRGFLSITPVRITNLIIAGICLFAMAETDRTIPGARDDPWLLVTGLIISVTLGTAWGVFLARNYSDAPKSI